MLGNNRSKTWPLLLIYVVITCLSLSALFITIWFSKASYSSLVNFITHTLNRPDLKSLITNSLFTYDRYQLIYKLHWLLYPVIIVAASVLLHYAKAVHKNFAFAICYLRCTFLHVIIFFKNLKRKERLLLITGLTVYVVLVLYNDHSKEISYDEAWGYNYYINQPFYFPLILFNTYPLYNFISHFFTFLPFGTLINIRLSSLAFGILTLLALFYTLRKEFSIAPAITGVIVLLASPLFYVYSTLARGITLSLFLAVIVLHVTMHLISGTTFKKRYLFLYFISNLAGIISMPTFIVFTISNSLFLIWWKRKQPQLIKSIVFINTLIFSGSFIFYLPVLLNAGPSLIYHNDIYVFNIEGSADELLAFIFSLSQLFFISRYAAIVLLFISALLPFLQPFHQKKPVVSYCLFIIVFSLFIRAVTGNIFPDRSLSFLMVNYIIIVASIVSIVSIHLPRNIKVVFTLSLAVLFALCCIHNQRILFSAQRDKDAKVIGELLIKNNVKTAYIDNEDFWLSVPMIQYYYVEGGKEIGFATSLTNSTRYRTFNMNDNYDCIITGSVVNSNMKGQYREIYRNSSFVLWKKL